MSWPVMKRIDPLRLRLVNDCFIVAADAEAAVIPGIIYNQSQLH
tara:strand:- start:950 stop:1081 length:132 start_codon:yes stop_codon:yes gene_type:complete